MARARTQTEFNHYAEAPTASVTQASDMAVALQLDWKKECEKSVNDQWFEVIYFTY